MKFLPILLVLTLISGCSSVFGPKKEVVITKEKPVAVVKRIPTSLLDCKVQNLDKIDVENLTDKKVSQIILTYNKDNTNCFNDVQAIKKINKKIIEQVAIQNPR